MLKMFKPITAESIAAKQLADSRVELLNAQANQEYYKHMCNMLQERINRLEASVGTDLSNVKDILKPASTKMQMPKSVPPIPTLSPAAG